MQLIKFRLFLLSLLFSLFSIFTYSQEFSEKKESKAIGTNLSFLNNFLPNITPFGNSDEYLFQFIKFKDDDKFTRLAVGFDIFYNYSIPGEDNEQVISQFGLDYKISKGRRKSIFKNTSFLYGGELLVSPNFVQNISSRQGNIPSESTDILTTLGVFAGPFIGLEYKINQHFGLYTEFGVYLGSDLQYRRSRKDFPQDNETFNFSVSVDSWIKRPASIILFYYI